MTYDKMHPFQRSIVVTAGELAGLFSFNRSLGQIFGFLYISPDPVSLEDIAGACLMSKANASLHLRTLEQWGAVHRSWKPGTRKDYYIATRDLKKTVFLRLQEGLSKRLQFAKNRLAAIKEDPTTVESLKLQEGKLWSLRIKEVESLLVNIESGFHMLPKLFKLKNWMS